MTLEDLDETLPNGLHDAQIEALTHDDEGAIVKLEARILVGLPDDPPSDRSRYRNGQILFHNVLLYAIGAPNIASIPGHP